MQLAVISVDAETFLTKVVDASRDVLDLEHGTGLRYSKCVLLAGVIGLGQKTKDAHLATHSINSII